MDYDKWLALNGYERTDEVFRLLDLVRREGSISGAAERMGVSYRYAWGLIRKAEDALEVRLVEKRAGGADGGGTVLTELGQSLISAHGRFLVGVEAAKKTLEGKLKAGEPSGRQILMATTIGPVEVGLIDLLEREYFAETGLIVRHVACGSGQAHELAWTGRVDLVLSHAPDLEEETVREGYGEEIVPLMHNDFILVGPEGDPAGVRGLSSVVVAFRRILAAGASFVTRGDRSGTHLKETGIWDLAGCTPSGPWYRVCPEGFKGSLKVLDYADVLGGYALVDRACYLTVRKEVSLQVMVAGDSLLANPFSLVPVRQGRFPFIDSVGVKRFCRWLTMERGRDLIAAFGVDSYGEALFKLPGKGTLDT